MIDKLRTVIARFIVHHLRHPLPLLIAAYLWLAAEADDLEEKRRCPEAVLELDPENTRALLALAVLRTGNADD